MATDSFWSTPGEEEQYYENLQRAQRRREQAARLVTEESVARMLEITNRHPNLSSGAAQGSVAMNLDDRTVEQVAQHDDGGGFFGFLGDAVDAVTSTVASGFDLAYEYAVKPAIRGAFLLSEGLAQEIVQRPLTSVFAPLSGNAESVSQAYRDYGDSALVNLIQGDRDTSAEGGSLGTGFFAGGEIGARTQQERSLMIDGHRATLGRGLASAVGVDEMFGNDSFAYNAVSGLTQFAVDIFADPLAIATGGSSKLASGAVKLGATRGGKVAEAIEGGISGVRQAARSFEGKRVDEATRLVENLKDQFGAVTDRERWTVLPERVGGLIKDDDVISALRDADQFDIARSWNRSSANMMHDDLINALGKADTNEEVAFILADAIANKKITQEGFYSGLRGFRKRAKNWKITGVAARGQVDVDDIPNSWEKLDSFMKQANLGEEVRRKHANRLFQINDTSVVPTESRHQEFYNLVKDVMADVSPQLDLAQEEIDELLKVVTKNGTDVEKARTYGIAFDGEEILTPITKIEEDGVMVPTPMLTDQIADLQIYLPDVTDIRRAAKRAFRAQKLWKSKGWSNAADAADWVTRDLFKPAALLRPAYVIRIGLEEQLRLTAAGYDSIFNHPVRFIQANLLGQNFAGRAGKGVSAPLAKLQRKFRPVDSEFTQRSLWSREEIKNVLDEDEIAAFLGEGDRTISDVQEWLQGKGFDEETVGKWVTDRHLKTDDALTRQIWEDMNAINMEAHNQMGKISKRGVADPWQVEKIEQGLEELPSNAADWWDRELHQAFGDAAARFLAKEGYDLDAFVNWARTEEAGKLWVDRLSRVNEEMGNALRTDDEVLREMGHSVAVFISAKAGGRMRKLADDVDQYEILSLGDDEMLDYIATGKRSDDLLHRKYQEGKAPQFVRRELKGSEDQGRFKETLDRWIDWAFEELTGRPTNTFARYPVVRQAYIKYAGESLDALANDKLRKQLVDQLDEMFTLTKKERQTLQGKLNRHAGSKGFIDDLDELDGMLKHRAGQETKDLLFDATRRSNFQDAYGAAVPFFDAWAEVTRTWARLAKENPAFFIRAGQGLSSAQESGVIYANDFGESVFAYPGGGMLSQFFPGLGGGEDAQLRLEGRLQGANLIAQGVGPGFGPVVQWATGAFLPKARETQGLREWIAPFGTGGIDSATDLANPLNIGKSLMPAWMRKMSNAITGGQIDAHQFNSTMGDVAKILAESNEYDPTKPGEQQRLLNDAQTGAKTILLMRGLIQGVGITGPSATWQVRDTGTPGAAIPAGWEPETDPDGTWHSLGVLANEYRRLRDHYQDDQIATAKFLDLYGHEPFYISQAKTRSLGNLPVTEEGDFWIREHAEAAEQYKATIGYFVPPEADTGKLDYSIYRSQIEKGDRQSLTAEQQIQMANKTKARAILSNVERQLQGAAPARRRTAMAQVRAWLEEEFPGWSAPVLGVQETLRASDKISELERAVNDPALADSPLVNPLREYLRVRSAAQEANRARTGQQNATLGRQDAADLRQMLRGFGTQLQSQNAAFAGVWSRLLSQEVSE